MKKNIEGMRSVVSFSDLTNDIIADILLRLEVKSLLCCKCVCKSWQTLIRQQSFINNHYKRQPSSVIVFQLRRTKTWYEKECSISYYSESFNEIQKPNKKLPPWLSPKGSDNGVLCFCDLGSEDIHLWNPTTNKWKKLPSPPTPRWKNLFHRLGLGYDSLNDDFKVVRICAERLHYGCEWFKTNNEVSVYSLRSDSWKRVAMPNIFSSLTYDVCVVSSQYRCTVAANGSIHWMLYLERVSDELEGENSMQSHGIVAFDMRTEVFKLFNLPQLKYGANFLLGKLFEHLSLVATSNTDQGIIFEIWMMKEYGVSESWVKQVKVDLNACPLELPSSLLQCDRIRYIDPLAFANNGNLLFKSISGLLICYDFQSGRVKYLDSTQSYLIASTTYAESIIPI